MFMIPMLYMSTAYGIMMKKGKELKHVVPVEVGEASHVLDAEEHLE